MVHDRLAVGFAILFVAAALGWLFHRIAIAKGRSAWWALAGLGLHVGLIVVLGLPAVRRTRPGTGREPEEPGGDAAALTEDTSAGARDDAAEPGPQPACEWESQLMRRPRMGWRSNDLLYLSELALAFITSGWLFLGVVGVTGIAYSIVFCGTVTVNGVPTGSIPAKLGLMALFACFGGGGAAYLFHVRPRLMEQSERYAGRRAGWRRGVGPPCGP